MPRRNVGAMIPYDVAADQGIGCHLVQPDNLVADRFLLLADDFQRRQVATADLAWSIGTSYVLDVQRSGTSYQCTVTGSASAAVMGNASVPASPPSIGIRVYAMTAAIHWVLVIGSSTSMPERFHSWQTPAPLGSGGIDRRR